MTKKEKQRSLTKEFLTWVKDIYPKAEFDDSEGYGYTDISIDGDFKGDNVISFRRHQNQVDAYNWAEDHVLEAEKGMSHFDEFESSKKTNASSETVKITGPHSK